MIVEKLKKSDLNKFIKLAKNVIRKSSLYNEWAKREELKKFNSVDLKKKMGLRKNYFLCTKEKDKIIGFVCGDFGKISGISIVNWIGIDNNYRKKGVGVALVEEVFKQAKSRKTHRITANIRTNNTASVNLFKKCGFKVLATYKNHWYKQDFFQFYKDIN